MKTFFQHESLPAYQAALEFAKWSEAVLERTPKNSAAYAQLDQGRIALSCKIAAAHGRLPASEQCGLLAAAQRIALESAACLDLLFNKRILSRDELEHGKEALRRIVAALADWNNSPSLPGHEPEDLRVAAAELKSG
ncbi:MAG TPA: hypothetical protein VGK40_08390 [Verrucomicrobiae bacterium]|jgi:hypothetical protein